MDHLTNLVNHWIGFGWSQISDATFWWGAGTTLLGLIGLAAIPALRGAIAPLTGGASRLFTGYYFYWRNSYPDIISAMQHILLHHPGGRVEFCLDTIFGERTLATIMWNPYRAFQLRQTADFASATDPLMRLNPHGPKRRSRFAKPLTAKRIGELRLLIRRRYKALYSPLVGIVAEHYTNPGAVRASRGETMVPMRIILAKTYTGPHRHHRLHGIHEWVFLRWPAECPHIARPEYRERHELTLKLLEMYRRTPWRFDFIDEFVPASEAPEGYVEWLYRAKVE